MLGRGLHRRYPWLFTYLAVGVVCSVGLIWLTPNPRSKAYAYAWASTEPILMLLQIAVAVEIYRLISRHYRNFDRMRPRLFWTCFLSAAAISCLALIIDLRRAWPSRVIQSIILGQRVSTFALAAFVIALAVFLRIFPIPIRPNVTAHRRIATAYFLANAAHYFTLDLAPGAAHAANIALMCLTGGCFLAWMVFLTPRGEDVDELPPPTEDEIENHLRRGDELTRGVESLRP